MANPYNINSKLARSPEGVAFGKAAQVVLASQLTDGGGTTGTITMTQKIPAKSFVLGTYVKVFEALDDDGACTMKVGKTSGEDEFVDGSTINMATAGDKGESPEDPLEFLASETTVYIQVTSDTDISSVIAGDGKFLVEVLYLTLDVSDLTRGYPSRTES